MDGSVSVLSDGEHGKPSPAIIWTTTSENPRPLFSIPEASERDRRFVPRGVHVRCSPLRAVENFLDSIFPLCTLTSGQSHIQRLCPTVDIDETKDEVIATQVKFQPQAAKSANEGIVTEYTYRVPSP